MRKSPLNHNHKVTPFKRWSRIEQAVMEKELAKYASYPSILRYVKAASMLHTKDCWDVALRVRWMKEKSSHHAKKSSSLFAPHCPNVSLLHAPENVMIENHYDISHKDVQASTLNFEPTSNKLLEQNAHNLSQVSSDPYSFDIAELLADLENLPSVDEVNDISNQDLQALNFELTGDQLLEQNAHTLSQVSSDPNQFDPMWFSNLENLSSKNDVDMSLDNHDKSYQDVQALVPSNFEIPHEL